MAQIEGIQINLSNHVQVAVQKLQEDEWEYEFLGNLPDENVDWLIGTIEGTFDELLEFVKQKAADMG